MAEFRFLQKYPASAKSPTNWATNSSDCWALEKAAHLTHRLQAEALDGGESFVELVPASDGVEVVAQDGRPEVRPLHLHAGQWHPLPRRWIVALHRLQLGARLVASTNDVDQICSLNGIKYY